MKRAALERKIAERELRHHQRFHIQSNLANSGQLNRLGKSPFEVDCVCDRQVNRFRKRRGRGCPRCGRWNMCKYNRERLFNNGKAKQQLQNQILNDTSYPA